MPRVGEPSKDIDELWIAVRWMMYDKGWRFAVKNLVAKFVMRWIGQGFILLNARYHVSKFNKNEFLVNI
jgi:hypothetical protein